MSGPAVIPVPIGLWRGDPFTLPLVVKKLSDPDDPASEQVPVDLTAYGATFAAQLRTRSMSLTDVAFDVDATDAATGTLTLSLTPAVTAVLVYESYGFDVQAFAEDGTPGQTLLTGKLNVQGDYTRV